MKSKVVWPASILALCILSASGCSQGTQDASDSDRSSDAPVDDTGVDEPTDDGVVMTGTGGATTGVETGSGGTLEGTGGSETMEPPEEPRTRVVGYLPNWNGDYSDWISRVDFSKVTHINLAFALGTDDGHLGLAPSNEIDAFVTAAHAANVQVFPSLCGGGGDPTITPHYEPDKVDAFVDNIVDYALEHDFDGIDVDVEAPNKMGAKYDTFIAKLKAKAAPHGLPITAAVAQWMQWGMSDTTIRSFDFITVMSYDNCGTWTDACEHSSMQQARDALSFYEDKGVDRDKIVLGVPFYGYCWGNCNGQAKRYVLYKDIVALNGNAPNMDWFEQNGATYSYNGVQTMKDKAELGESYGGIMIWELSGDLAASHDSSLLKALDDTL